MPSQKDTVKPWFQTNDFPLQEQFYQMFDWLRWKDEKIEAGDLSDEILTLLNGPGRKIMLASGTLQWSAPAGTLLEKFIIRDTGSGQSVDVKIGTSLGGNDVLDTVTIDTTDSQAGIITKDFYCKTDCIIYFTLTASNLLTLLVNIYKN